MTIADAARATRTYATALNESGMFSVVPWIDAGAEQTMFKHSNEDVALAACDHLNLLAVLEAIRDPRIIKRAMRPEFADGTLEELCALEKLWPSAIDALIGEVRGQT